MYQDISNKYEYMDYLKKLGTLITRNAETLGLAPR